jgi:ATP-dependent helicase YprA (DUF1998 family)
MLLGNGGLDSAKRTQFDSASNTIFGNSRRIVEELGAHFRGDCYLAGQGEPAVALHHGSLSARLRRRTESMLKTGKPVRAFCTSSLELGIDSGAVKRRRSAAAYSYHRLRAAWETCQHPDNSGYQ